MGSALPPFPPAPLGMKGEVAKARVVAEISSILFESEMIENIHCAFRRTSISELKIVNMMTIRLKKTWYQICVIEMAVLEHRKATSV